MEKFNASQAIAAGLLTELMTKVVQPEDPEEPPIIPSKLSGTYKLGATETEGKFSGYAFELKQESLEAQSISGEFENTEELLSFCKELQNSGATLELEEVGGVQKYSVQQAIDNNLIFGVRDGSSIIAEDFSAQIKKIPTEAEIKF